MTLAEVPTRQTVRVVQISAQSRDRRRLTELGLRSGSEVEVVRRAPLGGPLALRSAGGRFALRVEDASQVVVEGGGDDA